MGLSSSREKRSLQLIGSVELGERENCGGSGKTKGNFLRPVSLFAALSPSARFSNLMLLFLFRIEVTKVGLNTIISPFNEPPVALAIAGGHIEIVEYLLDLPEVDLVVKDAFGMPAAFFAIESPCAASMLAFLMAHPKMKEVWPALDDRTVKSGFLGQACIRGNEEAVKWLLKEGADVTQASVELLENPAEDEDDLFGPDSALHYAAQSGNLGCIALILEAGAEVDALDDLGRTALFTAIQFGHLSLVQYLIEKENSNFNVIDSYDMTPRDFADSSGMSHIAMYLARKGAKSHFSPLRHPRGIVAQWSRVWMQGDRPTPRNQPHMSKIGNHVYILGGWDLSLTSASPYDDYELEHPGSGSCFRFCINDIHTTTLRGVTPPSMRPNSLSKKNVAQFLQVSDNWHRHVAFHSSKAHPSSLESSQEDEDAIRRCVVTNVSPPAHFSRAISVLFDDPFTPSPATSVSYFEVKITSLGEAGMVAVGFAPANFPFSSNLPGWTSDSYAYHSDDGSAFFHLEATPWGPIALVGDTIGAGIHWEQKCVFYTHNGQCLGSIPVNGIGTSPLFGCIGTTGHGTSLEVNFGVAWHHAPPGTVQPHHASTSPDSSSRSEALEATSSANHRQEKHHEAMSIARNPWLFNFEVLAVKCERVAPIEENTPSGILYSATYEFPRLNVTIGPYVASVSSEASWVTFFDTRTSYLYKMSGETVNPFQVEPDADQIAFGEDKIFYIDLIPMSEFKYDQPGYEMYPAVDGILLRMFNLKTRRWSEARVDLRHFKRRPLLDIATSHIPYADGKLWFLASVNSPFYIDVKKMRGYLMPSVRKSLECAASYPYVRSPDSLNLWNCGSSYANIPTDERLYRDMTAQWQKKENSTSSHSTYESLMGGSEKVIWPSYNQSDINSLVPMIEEHLVLWNGNLEEALLEDFHNPPDPPLPKMDIIRTKKSNATTLEYEEDEAEEERRNVEDKRPQDDIGIITKAMESVDATIEVNGGNDSSELRAQEGESDKQGDQLAVFGGILQLSELSVRLNMEKRTYSDEREGYISSRMVRTNDILIFGPKDKKWTVPRVVGYRPSPKGQCGMTYMGEGQIAVFGGNTSHANALSADLDVLTFSSALSRDDSLSLFFNNPLFSDFEVHLSSNAGSEAQVIKLHKAILCGRSLFFRILLASDLLKPNLPSLESTFPLLTHLQLSNPNRLDVPADQASFFKMILQFLYCDTVPSDLLASDYTDFMDVIEVFLPEHVPRLGELLFLNRLTRNSSSILHLLGSLLVEPFGLALTDAKIFVVEKDRMALDSYADQTSNTENTTSSFSSSSPSPTSSNLASQPLLSNPLLSTSSRSEPILVHRAILCARSEYFRALFSGSLIEGREAVAVVSGIPHRVCQEIVRYLYTQKLDIGDDMAEFVVDFMIWAHAWAVSDLFESLQSLIIDNLTFDNVEYLENVALEHSCPRLAQECRKFVSVPVRKDTGGAAATMETSKTDSPMKEGELEEARDAEASLPEVKRRKLSDE